MRTIKGIIYKDEDEPDEAYIIDEAIINVFYPAEHDEQEAIKNRAEVNRICNLVIDDLIKAQINK